MRLIVTYCDQCNRITDAKHAETISDLENLSEFIRSKKKSGQKLALLDIRDDEMLRWCICIEQINSSMQG